MFGRRSGLFSAIRERRVWGASDRHGVRGSTRGKLDSVINGFVCTRGDEYFMEEMQLPPSATGFCKVPGQEHVLCVCGEDGSIQLYCTKPDKCNGQLSKWKGHGTGINDLEWSPHQSIMVTASRDKTARMWDMESTNLMGVFKGHTKSVTSASFRTNDKWVFCTGARDGNILVWDGRCSHNDGFYHPVNSIRNAHELQMPSTPRTNPQQEYNYNDGVTCAVYQDENTIVSAGSMDGTIKLWDMRMNYRYCKHSFQCPGKRVQARDFDMSRNIGPNRGRPISRQRIYASRAAECRSLTTSFHPGTGVKFLATPQGRRHLCFSSLVVDSAGTRLFASCTDSTIYMYNCHSMETQPVATFTGHTCSSYSMETQPVATFTGHTYTYSSFVVRCALSPCEEYLLSGSSEDASAYIWKVNDPEACPWKLTGHNEEVTAVAWCQDDFTTLITCSDDYTMRVWRHQPLTDKERDPNDVVGDVQRVVRTPQKSAGTWKPETFDSGVRTVGVGSPRMATTVSNKVPTANAASPKHAAGASPNAEAVATAGLPTPENEQS